MGKNDALAQGARKATFAVGTSEVNDEIILHNVAPEGSREDFVPEPTVSTVVRKRFVPLKGVLLIRREEAKSPSGILITETMEKERPAEGIVLEAGPETTVSKGDYVIFGKYSGAEFSLNGETLLLMDNDEIKGILVDEESEPLLACGSLAVPSRFIASA